MKRILTSFAILVASVSFAQVSISGNNTDEPKATLDVKAIANGDKPDGILIPRVSVGAAQAMQNVETSTLIYINDISGVKGNQTQDVDAVGFYYFDRTKWVKLGGAGATSANIYTEDGAITSNRTVTVGENKKITFQGGATHLNGAGYVNSKTISGGTEYSILNDDYHISIDGPTLQFKVYVPQPSQAKGRVLIFTNKTANNLVLNLLAEDGKTPTDAQVISGSEQSQIPANKGEWIISDGTKWYNLINY